MILLIGGTGFLGSHIVEELRVAKQLPIRILTLGEGDWHQNSLSNLKEMGIESIVGNILNPRVVAAALDGCSTVINASGRLRTPYDTTYRDLHVDAVKIICEEAIKKGVQRLIHVSCLGAGEYSNSEYYRLKWEGEQIVKKAELYWTIFRPAYLFGDRCEFINLLKPLLKVPMVLPVIGSGLNHLQLVCVEDVASCIVQSLPMQETIHQVIDLIGPNTYTLYELMTLLRSELPTVKPTIAITLALSLKILKPLHLLLPKIGLNAEFIHMLTCNLQGNPMLMKKYFQIKEPALEQYIQRIVHQTTNK